jgi:hypothetical protein
MIVCLKNDVLNMGEVVVNLFTFTLRQIATKQSTRIANIIGMGPFAHLIENMAQLLSRSHLEVRGKCAVLNIVIFPLVRSNH